MRTKTLTIFLLILAIVMVGGCVKTPDGVKAAHEAEGDLLVTYKNAMVTILDAAATDLEAMYQSQLDIIMDYEIKGQGDTIAKETVQSLLEQYRASVKAMREEMANMRKQIAETTNTMEQALQLHNSINRYLNTEPVKIGQLITDTKNAFKEIANGN